MLWHATTADSYTSECGRYRVALETVGFGMEVWQVYRDGKWAAVRKQMDSAQQWAQEDSQK